MNHSHHKNRSWALLMAGLVMLVASCSSSSSWLPPELALNRVLYQTKDARVVGPGGINQSFAVYELPAAVSATIANKGLPYLNSLPTAGKKVSTATGPWWAPFSNWRATPVPSEKAWLRRGRDLGDDWKPSITTFYVSFKGDDTKKDFISTIAPEFGDGFHEAISTPGSFYAYGDYRGLCLVVVSPRTGKVYYLFRD